MTSLSTLSAFPHPNVAVDLAVLSVRSPHTAAGSGSLVVLVQEPRRPSASRVLPGRFLRERQTVVECVADVLRLKAGLPDAAAEPRLLRVFDAPDRDPRGWTLSLAHSLTLTPRQLRPATGELVDIARDGRLETGESLLYDHDAIVREAAAAVRDRYERGPDPDQLLEEAFSMAQLRSLHEAVLGERLLKDTFRRRMEPQLEPVLTSDGSPVLRSDGGRPAQVYRTSRELRSPASTQRGLRLPRGGS